jgi:hypothetical protein
VTEHPFTGTVATTASGVRKKSPVHAPNWFGQLKAFVICCELNSVIMD